eukprot:Opistho-2@15329
MDARAQAHHLVHVHEAVLEDGLGDHRGAARDHVQGHELGLHVGREAGVFGGAEALRLQVVVRGALRADADAVGLGHDGAAGVAQLVDHGVEVVAARMAQEGLAARGRHGAQEGAGLDAVGHHGVLAAVQLLDALDADVAGAVAFDLRAHADQHFGQVDDLGLLRGVLEQRLALGQRGGHEEVLGAGDGDHVGQDARALQPRAALGQARDHVAVLDHDLGAHRLQALDVLVDRPRADGAAARQRHLGMAEARQQRAQRQHRGAHGLHQFVGGLGIAELAGVQAHGAVVVGLGRHAHVAHQLEHGRHVLQARHVVQHHGLVGQQRRAQLGQRGVLGAGNEHFAAKLTPAANQKFVHEGSSEIRRPAGAGKSFVHGGPFGRRVGLHRERMHLVGVHFRTEGGVDPLVALDGALALEFGRDDGRVPMSAVAPCTLR